MRKQFVGKKRLAFQRWQPFPWVERPLGLNDAIVAVIVSVCCVMPHNREAVKHNCSSN